VSSLSDLYADYDVVVNCSGCGAKHLAHDTSLKPARGVTIRLEAPWIKQACELLTDAAHGA
jgi:L-2-hydroxyglutarate oxidase LhgO